MTANPQTAAPVPVAFVVNGQLVEGADVLLETRGLSTPFATPKLDLDALTSGRHIAGPAFDLPTSEVIDFLVATGERLRLADNVFLQEALDHMVRVNPLGRRIVGQIYDELGALFDRESLQFQLQVELGDAYALDGWREVQDPKGRRSDVRAIPPRLVHVLAGNAPTVSAVSIVRGALTKGVNVLKLPSNDLFTATAILRTMAEIDPEHPTLRSFSAVYWRGGDDAVESVLYRPQWFDKLVAWGGEGAIRSALRYVGPGFELVSFDPKTSISLIGREAFSSDSALRQVADLGAADATICNQEACGAARFQFIEGSVDDADRYCEQLAVELSVDRPTASAVGPPTPAEIRVEVDVLRHLEPDYRVWGTFDGHGLVIRSDEPVEFIPIGKTVNVIPVASLEDAVRYVTVATQTVGVYPSDRKTVLRDALGGAGAQRIVPLGHGVDFAEGLPHDGIYPLQRLVRWVVDEGR
ncbi:MAG: hypothetical protein QOG75_7527 [Mycobacterium sp.]|jgi:hypothetical protein|nr:hypothetical protein [Mycobacterium sp.]